jgi:hypothetical protein
MTALPVLPAHALPACPEERRWLIEGLWADQAVGIVGGEPKCCKSFLALDMAVAVASGRPCLRHFAVAQPGRVLLFAAEDALHVVRQRLEGICAAAGASLDALDVQVITAPTVRLDLEGDRRLLAGAVEHLAPRLVVLDPFVRLHRIDENVSGEGAPRLAWLRELSRRHSLAVAVVHHAKKGAARARAGQALRGSSEFHAWGDSNLYLRRSGDELSLSIEHRAAPSRTGVPLALVERAGALALEVVERDVPPVLPASALERVAMALAQASEPASIGALREACHMRTQSVSAALGHLVAQGRAVRTPDGFRPAGTA